MSDEIERAARRIEEYFHGLELRLTDIEAQTGATINAMCIELASIALAERFERKGQLENALADLCERAERCRNILQNETKRKHGWTDREIRQFANWGMLNTDHERALLACNVHRQTDD